MATDDRPRCSARVWENWGDHQCGFRSLPGKDKCGIHDPERKAARKKKRGPTQVEREMAQNQRRSALISAAREVVRRFRNPSCQIEAQHEVNEAIKLLEQRLGEYDAR